MENIENTNNNRSTSVAVQAGHQPGWNFRQRRGQQPQSYIPFLFKNKPQGPPTTITPAPGQYQSKSMFNTQNQRDMLVQKYHILMENTKKIKQSVIFKSTAKRFNYKEEVDQIPISYSYRHGDKGQLRGDRSKGREGRGDMWKSMSSLGEKAMYPSIPDRTSKYGYALGELGKLRKIIKTQNQLQKQRQTMKQYAKKLTEQKPSPPLQSHLTQIKQKSKLLSKVKQKIASTPIHKPSHPSLHNHNHNHHDPLKYCKKPILSNNSKCNLEKISKIIQDKKMVVNKLGPDCYDADDSKLGRIFRPERFQFFSSSCQRFPTFKEEFDQIKDQNYLKKKQIEDKMTQARKTKSSNFRKCLKRPIRTSDKSDQSSKQPQHPGPGDYNPTQRLIKANIGKVNAFDRSERFDKFQNKQNNQPDNESKMISLKLTRQNSKKNIPLKDHCYSNYVNSTEIIKRNKEFLKNKRERMEESIKKYKNNGLSDFSICSWESRPFSRNQGAACQLLQTSFRNQN